MISNIKAVLAPMAGITGYPLRKIMIKYGAPFCYTEMISAQGLLYGDKGTKELVYSGGLMEETGLQLFGSDPVSLSEAAKKAHGLGFEAIDINMGCPVKKVVKTGAGSAILKDMEVLASIIRNVRNAVKNTFLTVKMRSGFEERDLTFLKAAKIAETEGINAIFFHPRTRSLMFGGNADHSLTKKLKQYVSIPVYASGDMFTAADSRRVLEETGADGVLFARGAIGNPLIFREFFFPEDPESSSFFRKASVLLELMEEMGAFYGKERGAMLIKPHLYNFLKGFKGSKELRCKLNSASNEKDIGKILEEALALKNP